MTKWLIGIFIALVIVVLSVYTWHQNRKSNNDTRMTRLDNYKDYSVATFAGGCFWCSESDFEKTDGVFEVVSGYTGGTVEHPTYKQVSSGDTGHREAVQVYFDPMQVSYAQLLDVFWRHIDPTDDGGQFADRGHQYTSAIYYHDQDQKREAERSMKELAQAGKFDKPIVVAIEPFTQFYVAEDYHQDYHHKNKKAYAYYRERSGRDDYITRTWGQTLHGAQKHLVCDISLSNNTTQCDEDRHMKPSQDVIKSVLTKEQYAVTQDARTEKPFDNLYWDNEKEGIYVDVVSGEPLFSSLDKYDSGTGWPSFVKPISKDRVVLKSDLGLHVPRTEVRSKIADSHLGHVFDDGPVDRGGKRYCMNSAALRFIAKEDLEKEGYGDYVQIFD